MHARRGQRSPIAYTKNRDLSTPENLLMTSAFTVRLPVQTLEVEVKKSH